MFTTQGRLIGVEFGEKNYCIYLIEGREEKFESTAGQQELQDFFDKNKGNIFSLLACAICDTPSWTVCMSDGVFVCGSCKALSLIFPIEFCNNLPKRLRAALSAA